VNYRSFSDYAAETFGTKVYRLSLSSGCTCPNRDGTIGSGGCTFCSAGGSGDFAAPFLPIDEQIRRAKLLVDPKFPASVPADQRRYVGYFQSYTNTYGDPDRLLNLFRETAAHPEIAALSIATRPDCLPDEILDGLEALNKEKPVWIELGLQTIHEKTAERIRRGYRLPVFEDAYRRITARGISVIVHVILGLPGETREDMLETVRYLSGLSPVPSGVKLQLLHILKGTALAREYAQHPFPVMTLPEYASLAADCIALLPEETVIHRITGDGPKRLLIAPLWSADKKRVLNTLRRVIAEDPRQRIRRNPSSAVKPAPRSPASSSPAPRSLTHGSLTPGS
jgi:radical SAM protein (TIGR01212 family)